MNFEALDAALVVEGGTLSLTDEMLPGAGLGALLTAFNDGQPLDITGAAKQASDPVVIVTGECSFLGAPVTRVTAAFTVDAAGTPVAQIHMALPGATDPNPWKFSQSFPDLPTFPVAGALGGIEQTPFLDTLAFTMPAFVLATQAGADPQTKAPLSAGLNFVGMAQLDGKLGVLQALLAPNTPLLLSGTITTADQVPAAPALARNTYPWQAGATVPGINLAAVLPGSWSLSSVTMDTLRYRVYAPPSSAWMGSNPTYQPVTAIGGRLTVPSAGLAADANAAAVPGSGTTVVSALFSQTVSSLDALADVANGTDLFRLLPSGLQTLGPALSGLTLQTVSLTLTGGIAPGNVSEAYLAVAMPNATWSIQDLFSLAAPTAEFTVTSPFGSGRAAAAVLKGTLTVAGAPMDATATAPAYEARATLAGTAAIPLGTLFGTYLPSLAGTLDTSVGALSVDQLDVSVQPGTGYQFDARVADSTPWQIDAGPAGVTVSNVQIQVSSGSAGATGSIGGEARLGESLSFTARYDLPGSFSLRATLPDVKLSTLIAQLDRVGITLPDGFELDFSQGYVLIEGGSGDRTFTVASMIDNVGLVAFTAKRAGGAWGFAAGIDTTGLSGLPGLSALAPLEHAVGLRQLMVIVSSLTDTGFEFPDLSAFDAPSFTGKSLSLPAQAEGVTPGINAYALLDSSTNVAFRTLAGWLNLALDGTVGVVLSISPNPAKNSRLFITVDQEVSTGMHLAGTVGLMLQDGKPAGFLTGTLTAELGGKSYTFDAQAQVFPNGVLVSGNARAEDGGAQGAVATIGPVQLAGLGLVIGMNFEGVPSVGVAATIAAGDFQSSIAVFFDSVNPGSSLVAGSISAFTLADVARLAGQTDLPSELSGVLGSIGLQALSAAPLPAADSATLAAALGARDLAGASAVLGRYGISLPTAGDQVMLIENTPSAVWHLTNMNPGDGSTMTHYRLEMSGGAMTVSREPQLYLAPEAVTIGSFSYSPGFQVVGELDFLVLRAQVDVQVSTNQGIAASATLAPITLGNADFFAITDSAGTGGATLSIATYSRPAEPDPNLRGQHARVSGAVRILGATVAGVYLDLDENGLDFKVKSSTGPTSFTLSGSVSRPASLSASGSVWVGIDESLDLGELGTVHVLTKVAGSLSLAFDGTTASATLSGSFTFEGLSGSLPPVSLAVSGPVLENLAETLWGDVEGTLRSAFQGADVWLQFVDKSLVTGISTTATAVGQVLAQQYDLAASDIASSTQTVLNYGADQIAQALSGAGVAANAAASALADLGYGADVVTNALQSAFSGLHVDVDVGGHLDTPGGPHLDTPTTHMDTPHTDGAGLHTDWSVFGKHVDSTIPPHVDTHIDTTTPHADTVIPPHVDTQIHIDT